MPDIERDNDRSVVGLSSAAMDALNGCEHSANALCTLPIVVSGAPRRWNPIGVYRPYMVALNDCEEIK